RRQILVADLLSRVTVKGDKKKVSLFAYPNGANDVVTVGEPMSAPPIATFVEQLAQVEAKGTERSARSAEIMAQLRFNPMFWGNVLPLNPRTTPNTLELLLVAVAFASNIVQRVKLIFNLPRPNELSPRIQPLITTPGFSTYPSGHGTEPHLVATVLMTLRNEGMP